MKDLKKALTISREKELVKSSRTKATPGTKSPVEKTEPKLSRQKLQTILKQQISPDLSSLTTKISPHAPKSVQESKQVIADLRNKIQQLQTELKQALNRHKSSRKQIYSLQTEIETLKKENQCLLEILTFEEQKSSAALQYITFLTQKINQNQVQADDFYECFDLIQTVKNANVSAVEEIKSAGAKKQLLRQNSFFGFEPIEEKVQHFDQSTERLVEELQEYKISIRELKQKIIDLESKENQKNYTISKFEKQITEFKQENSVLNTKNRKLEESIKEYDSKLGSIKLEANKSEAQGKLLEKSLSERKKQLYEVQNKLSVARNELSQTKNELSKRQNELSLAKRQLSESKKDISQTTNNYDKCKRQVNEWKVKFESVLRENTQLQETILKLEQRIQQLESAKEKLELSSEKLKKQQPLSKPQTPTQSEIIMRKTRFVDGEQLQNMLKQMNTQSSPLKQSILSRDYLRGSGKYKNQEQNQVQNDSDRFLSRNKSESLLKDLQQSDPQQSGIEDIADVEERKDQVETKEVAMKSTNKVVIIPEHKKQVQKYNYDFDIDSVNYFNNFGQNHQIMETSGDHQNNSSQNEIEPVSIRN